MSVHSIKDIWARITIYCLNVVPFFISLFCVLLITKFSYILAFLQNVSVSDCICIILEQSKIGRQQRLYTSVVNILKNNDGYRYAGILVKGRWDSILDGPSSSNASKVVYVTYTYVSSLVDIILHTYWDSNNNTIVIEIWIRAWMNIF